MEAIVEMTEKKKDGILVLYVSGRLDAVSSPQLEKKVMAAIDAEDSSKVLMDFEKVEYLSSAGMRLLLSTTKKMKNKNGKFVICSITEPVIEVIKMAGFDHILNIRANENEALKEF